jgi:hypothetical protein
MPREAKSGDVIKLKIKNVSSNGETIGVVMAVNGKSTLMLESIIEKAPKDCTKWILGPGEETVVDGFYTKELAENVKKFRVLSPEESQGQMQTDPEYKGKINIYVFFPKGQGPGKDNPMTNAKIENRSLRRGSIPHKGKPHTAEEAKNVVSRALREPTKRFPGKPVTERTRRDFIGEEQVEVAGMELQRVKFDFDPESNVSMVINYWADGLTNNGNKNNNGNNTNNSNKNNNGNNGNNGNNSNKNNNGNNGNNGNNSNKNNNGNNNQPQP